MSFPGDHDPEMNKESIEYSGFMHIQCGRLYTTNKIVHVLRDIFMVLNGLNPWLDKTSLTLRISSAESWCNVSKSFHSRPLVGCLDFHYLEHSLSCHLKESSIFEVINRLLSLWMNGTCLIIFAKIRHCFFWSLKLTINFRRFNISWRSTSMTNSSSLWSFLNNMQSLGHESIVS